MSVHGRVHWGRQFCLRKRNASTVPWKPGARWPNDLRSLFLRGFQWAWTQHRFGACAFRFAPLGVLQDGLVESIHILFRLLRWDIFGCLRRTREWLDEVGLTAPSKPPPSSSTTTRGCKSTPHRHLCCLRKLRILQSVVAEPTRRGIFLRFPFAYVLLNVRCWGSFPCCAWQAALSALRYICRFFNFSLFAEVSGLTSSSSVIGLDHASHWLLHGVQHAVVFGSRHLHLACRRFGTSFYLACLCVADRDP
mmetsp:Transcript_28679/g.53737  ORF Transcript_28679/g.53737 Transcript_28679/m.53737 type:complete len:250 (-) Transcript_28679:154-903(-)